MNAFLINFTEQVLLAFERIRQAGEQLAGLAEASALLMLKPSVVRQKRSKTLPKDGLYYLLLVDMIGSTRYLAEHGNQRTIERINRMMQGIRKSCREAAYEKEVFFLKEIGDAGLVAFEAFHDVILFHRHWEKLNQDELNIKVRICIHCGELNFDDGNPMGLALSELFKMEKQALEGETLLSAVATALGRPCLNTERSSYWLEEKTGPKAERFYLMMSPPKPNKS